MDRLNGVPSVTRVLMLDPTIVPYFLIKDYVKLFGLYGEQEFPDVPDPQTALRRLPSFGASHVLDVNSVVGPFRIPPNQPGLTLVFETPNQRIYRIEGFTR
jgi:hypothetical protein